MSTHTFTYNRTHTSLFVADNMRNLIRDIIAWSGLEPTKHVDDWKVLGEAVRTWLRTEDLEKIVLEFYVPGKADAAARWDFPISYDGSGVSDDMWVARELVRHTIGKGQIPPANATYRVVLITREGRPDVPGMCPTTLRGTNGLVGRASGTAIATPDIMASLNYWRAAWLLLLRLLRNFARDWNLRKLKEKTHNADTWKCANVSVQAFKLIETF